MTKNEEVKDLSISTKKESDQETNYFNDLSKNGGWRPAKGKMLVIAVLRTTLLLGIHQEESNVGFNLPVIWARTSVL